jgi:hypothetical protein
MEKMSLKDEGSAELGGEEFDFMNLQMLHISSIHIILSFILRGVIILRCQLLV